MSIFWDLDRETYQLFIQEVLQLLEKIEEILVSIDRDCTPAKIEELVRAAHTIKGGAAQINLTNVQALAARLEAIFRCLDRKDLEIDCDLFNLLLQGYEFLRLSVLNQIENKPNLDDDRDILVQSASVFEQLEAILSQNPIADRDNLPKITEVDRDIKELICNTEIAEALENFERVLSTSSDRELLSQLQTQIAIFLDLGTVLGISEFVTIAQTSLATLEASPKAARNIGQLAKVGFNAVLQAVLNDNPKLETSDDDRVSQSIVKQDPIEQSKEAINSGDLDPILQEDAIDLPESRFQADTRSRVSVWEAFKQPELPSVSVKQELVFNASKSLVWQTGCNIFTLPYNQIEENLSFKFVKTIYANEQKYLRWQNRGAVGGNSQLLRIYQLSELLSYGYPQKAIDPSRKIQVSSTKPNSNLSIAIVRSQELVLALEIEIERIITASELIIKPFGVAITPPNYIYGCTILPDKGLAVAIDVPLLLHLTFDRANEIVAPSDSQLPQKAEVNSNNLQTSQFTLDNKPPTILVVDDSYAWRQILSITLEKNGYDVIQAKDGREGIERLRNNSKIQSIVSDLEMPNLNGLEFLSYCRQELLLTKLPFIFLTTSKSEQSRQQAKRLGATAYFTKPYAPSELLNALQSYI